MLRPLVLSSLDWQVGNYVGLLILSVSLDKIGLIRCFKYTSLQIAVDIYKEQERLMPTDLISKVTHWRPEELRAIINQCLDIEVLSCEQPTAEKIGRSAGSATLSVFRVAGQAQTEDGPQSWSAIVKVLGSPKHPRPSSEYDPLRELAVYRSGVFAELCGGVRSARCYAIKEREGLKVLWLEDLSEAIQPPWEPEYYVTAAYHIGQFNAHWPEDALPQWEWLSRDSLRDIFRTPRVQTYFDQLNELSSHPLVQRAAPSDVLPGLFQQWKELDALLGLAEATPKGVCHVDCHTKNLFPMHDLQHGDHTVAVDWAKVGIDCYGMDVAHMVSSAMKWLELSPNQAEPLVDQVFDAYITGLREAGWSGSEEQIRLTYLTRFGYEAARDVSILMNVITNPQSMATVVKLWEMPIEEICDRWAEVHRFFLRCHVEAVNLAHYCTVG